MHLAIFVFSLLEYLLSNWNILLVLCVVGLSEAGIESDGLRKSLEKQIF